MEKLFAMATTPVLMGLVYIYIRDKYEKEPWRLLLIGAITGAFATFPIMHISAWLARFMPITGQLGEAFFTSFAVSALSEEGLKFAALSFLIWRDKNFNEPMDGIVYAVFISLGFACVENVMYVFSPTLGGFETAMVRGLVSVPGHGFFAVAMGYYFALAKFEPQKKGRHIICALLVPYVLHGVYNTILLSGLPYYLFIFVPFLAVLWYQGLVKIRRHLAVSPFKSDNENREAERN